MWACGHMWVWAAQANCGHCFCMSVRRSPGREHGMNHREPPRGVHVNLMVHSPWAPNARPHSSPRVWRASFEVSWGLTGIWYLSIMKVVERKSEDHAHFAALPPEGGRSRPAECAVLWRRMGWARLSAWCFVWLVGYLPSELASQAVI